MSSVKIQGNVGGSGSIILAAPNTNNNQTLTLPDGTGTVVVNGVNGSLVSGTAVASTSGTSIDFTSIPSWVKRITVMFNGVSGNGSSSQQIQIGAGSITSSGYTSSVAYAGPGTGSSGANNASGFIVALSNSSSTYSGHIIITNISGYTWVCSSVLMRTNDFYIMTAGGNVTLSGILDRVRITTVNGTDTFDAGSINILYE